MNLLVWLKFVRGQFANTRHKQTLLKSKAGDWSECGVYFVMLTLMMRHIVLFTAWRLTTERPAWTSPACAEKFCYKKSYERAQLVKAQSRCLWNIDVDRVSVVVDSSKEMFISARTASISWIFPWAMGCCVIIAWFMSIPPSTATSCCQNTRINFLSASPVLPAVVVSLLQ